MDLPFVEDKNEMEEEEGAREWIVHRSGFISKRVHREQREYGGYGEERVACEC